MKRTRLRFLGLVLIALGVLIILGSSLCTWRTPAWGILIWGNRTDVFLGTIGLILLGASLIVYSSELLGNTGPILATVLLAPSAALLSLSLVEWYLRHPLRLHLRVPPQVLAIEQRLVEPSVGLRWPPNPGCHRTVVPIGNIPLTRQDHSLVAQERQQVTYYTDELGFPNRAVLNKADIIVLGDSFTKVADVPWEDRWVSMVERKTGFAVYNISEGGFCPSQEVELYARYGELEGVSLVLLGVYGINDIGDERGFAHFLESGLAPKEWAYRRAYDALPPPTFGFVQVARQWWTGRREGRLGSRAAPGELEPIGIGNTRPPTEVSYYPLHQRRAWECVYFEPSRSLGAQSTVSGIERMAGLCRAQGRRPGVLYFPLKQTIHPPEPDDQEAWINFLSKTLPWIRRENWPREKIVTAGRLLLEGDRRLEAYIAEACEALGVVFHSTIPALEAEVRESGHLMYYRFDTHWNTYGNRAVGFDVASWIATL